MFGLRSACAIMAPVDACADTMLYPGAVKSGFSQASPVGPRAENALSDGGCEPGPALQSFAPCWYPAHTSPESVSSWFTS